MYGSPEQVHLLTWGERTTLLQTPETPRQVPVDEGGRAGPERSKTTPSVTSGPYSTTAGRRSTTLHCVDNSCCQQCHCSRAQQGGPCVWSAEARVLRQRGTLRIQGTIPGSSETFICNSDYIEKVAPLLRRVQDHCDYGFSVGRYSS
jgi:hypothetical protein